MVVVCRKIDLYREKLVGELELLDDVQERIEACAGSDLRSSEMDGGLVAGGEAAGRCPGDLRFVLHEIVSVRQPFAGTQLFRLAAAKKISERSLQPVIVKAFGECSLRGPSGRMVGEAVGDKGDLPVPYLLFEDAV